MRIEQKFDSTRPSTSVTQDAWARVLASHHSLGTTIELRHSGVFSADEGGRQLQLARERKAQSEQRFMELAKAWWRGVPEKYRRTLPAPLRHD